VMAPWPEAIPLAATDGTTVYLPDHLEVYDSLNKNAELFTNLVRLEAGLLECGTYDFDLERVRAACGIRSPTDPIDPPQGRSDMERFFLGFADPALAWDLFSMIEHGRITRQLTNVYPGLFRRTDPLIADDLARRAARGNAATLRLAHVYCALVAVTLPPGIPPLSPARQHWLADFTARAAAALPPGAPVTAAARFLHAAYAELAEILVADDDRQRLDLPFGRRVRPDLALRADPAPDRLATAIVARYRRAGVGVYKTTVRTALADASRGTIAEVTIPPDPDHPLNANGIRTAASLPDIRDLLAGQAGVRTMTEDISGRIYWYPEWDARLGDFLDRHCRVVVQCSADGPVEAYQAIVNRHEALVTDIRLAFERIRPEGVALLRQWVDGDDFDYRALVDYAVDRAGGRSPSDRLYLKRLKQYRDVAVLLLVDLSRSTAGPAGHDPNQTVLDVERTAIALLCEALETLGDTYALAGFSGHGRQDVRYWPIKSFDAPLNEAVRGRIGALRPHRSTRMGAAIRHAAAELARVPCAVRLLLVLGDGFPNDIDYKKDYAIEDTRRAIGEARAHRIFTHGITVNVTADPKLDRLFGPTHQSVITDVTELPQRLWRIYHALTH